MGRSANNAANFAVGFGQDVEFAVGVFAKVEIDTAVLSELAQVSGLTIWRR